VAVMDESISALLSGRGILPAKASFFCFLNRSMRDRMVSVGSRKDGKTL
jgi:hypothetical protein